MYNKRDLYVIYYANARENINFSIIYCKRAMFAVCTCGVEWIVLPNFLPSFRKISCDATNKTHDVKI